MTFWQARSFDGRQPKYLAPPADKSRVTARYMPTSGSPTSVTLVEDILSAYKVGTTTNSIGWSLLGTKLNDHTLGQLMTLGLPVNVWLDNDLPPLHPVNRGQQAATKVLAQLRAMGIPARNVLSTMDPKLMPRSDIKELLA